MKKIFIFLLAFVGLSLLFNEPPVFSNPKNIEITSPAQNEDTLIRYDLSFADKASDMACSKIKGTINEVSKLKNEIKLLETDLNQPMQVLIDTVFVLDTVKVVDTIKQRKNIFGKIKQIN